MSNQPKKAKLKKMIPVILAVILIITCILLNMVMSKRYYSEKTGQLIGDQALYHSIALGILNSHSYYLSGNQKVDIGQAVSPFYPALVAVAYYIGGVNVKNPYILNVFFNCLTIILIFLTIKLITQKNLTSFLFSFIFIFYYPLWSMNFSIMMEVTTVFCLSLTIYLFTKYCYDKKIKYLYFSTAAFSILCLINNRFTVLLIVFIAFLLFYVLLNKNGSLKTFIMPVLIVIFTISPWFIRQYIVYDQFIVFTPLWNNVLAEKIGLIERINIPSGADDKASEKPLKYEEYIEDLKSYNTADIQQTRISAFTLEKYKKLIYKSSNYENIYMARLKKYFTLYYKDFQFVGPKDYRLVAPSSMPYKMVQILILLPLFLLSLLGIFMALKNRELFILFMIALFFSHVLLHVLVHYIDRYRLTIIPVLLIIAAYGFSEALKMLKKSIFSKKSKIKYIFDLSNKSITK